ncbi:MAG: type II secretion system protein M [Desulfobacterium sp.]|nr:type II secretion system protein M [Desulfobacterium sp.]
MTISQRDKKALIICAGFLITFVAVQFILVPALDRKKELANRVAAKEAALTEIISLQQEYARLSRMNMADTDILSKRAKGFTLFSFLDALAEKSGVKDNVAYMKPSSRTFNDKNYAVSMVKIKLDTLYLKELVDFLYRVESSRNGVHIRSLSLSKTGKEQTLLDAIVEAETLVKGDAA